MNKNIGQSVTTKEILEYLELKDEIEKSILDSNKEPMGPDGLPLNFPFNDGEGRLKGNN